MSDSTDKKRPVAKRKLGRGLGALLGEARREEPLVARRAAVPGEEARASSVGQAPETAEAKTDGLAMIAITDIEPHPDQPRRQFDEDALAELAASIAARGVI